MAGTESSARVGFHGKPHVDQKTGDIVFIAHMGLRIIRCRVRRSALKRFSGNPTPSDEELLRMFTDYQARIEHLAEEQVQRGELSPVIGEIDPKA